MLAARAELSVGSGGCPGVVGDIDIHSAPSLVHELEAAGAEAVTFVLVKSTDPGVCATSLRAVL